MKALSFLQPWLYAVLHMGKNVENRVWAPPRDMLGKTFALHASKGWDKHGQEFLSNCPGRKMDFWGIMTERGCILGTAKINGWVREDALKIVEEEKRILDSPWFFGPFGWLLEDVKPLPEPIPCKGALGFWTVPEDIEEKIRYE